jgi:acyl-CoA hydrolase
VEGVEFLSPVEVGDLVSIKAMVNYVGNTTMIIGMRVDALNPKTGVSRHTNSCYFTMAAKSDDGQLLQVPGLILETETELRRFCEARIIKQMSKQRRSLLLSDLKDSSMEMLREACVGERCILEIG